MSECYRKLGDLDLAREHFQQAQATIGALGDDEYGQMIKQGMERIAEQLHSRHPIDGSCPTETSPVGHETLSRMEH